MRDIELDDVDTVPREELQEKLLVAFDVLQTFTLPRDTHRILNFCLAVVKTLTDINPELLANLSQYITIRELKRRAQKEDA